MTAGSGAPTGAQPGMIAVFADSSADESRPGGQPPAQPAIAAFVSVSARSSTVSSALRTDCG